MIPVALSIAGSDPSGGAGIQADIKTFHQLGVYATTVLTLVTVQNTQSVKSVELLSPALVEAQLDAVLEDIPPHAAKTGALGDENIIAVVARRAAGFACPLVVDPVMISKHGLPLMTTRAREALAALLLPHAFLVTPNLHEAGVLAGMAVTDTETMEEAARRIASMGAVAVLVKGGHLAGDPVDVLYFDRKIVHFSSPRIKTLHTHGTGCTFSAAITAGLARQLPLYQAIENAKKFISLAIQSNPGLGHGRGPVNHQVTF
jgi:hydroxymethylpyrimidine/phosphomethylpyrimidine kinase